MIYFLRAFLIDGNHLDAADVTVEAYMELSSCFLCWSNLLLKLSYGSILC